MLASTVSGGVKVTACAKDTSTVDWASPIRSFPCNPRIIYFASGPWARTNNFLMLFTLLCWDLEPVVLAISKKTPSTSLASSGFGLAPKDSVRCFPFDVFATVPKSPSASYFFLTIAIVRIVVSILYCYQRNILCRDLHTWIAPIGFSNRLDENRVSDTQFHTFICRRNCIGCQIDKLI